DIGRRPEGQLFPDVIASVDAVEDPGLRVYGFRTGGHQFEDLGAAFRRPGVQILGTAMQESKALAGLFLLAFDKGIEVAERRSLPALGVIGCRSGLQRGEKIGSPRASHTARRA